MGRVEVSFAPMFEGCEDLHETLYALLSSIQPGDFFALNAFLPFTGEGRREAIEQIRHGVAESFGCVSCLEVGPRYLHSTGQLHKGGPNTGVFLVVSADEPFDITVPHEDFTLGDVANAEALGDFSALASRGRRAIYIHLKDNDDRYLSSFANDACSAISAAYALRTR